MRELIELISKRDGISFSEAESLVQGCREELLEVETRDFFGYEEACEIVAEWLGLEPDHLDILLEP